VGWGGRPVDLSGRPLASQKRQTMGQDRLRTRSNQRGDGKGNALRKVGLKRFANAIKRASARCTATADMPADSDVTFSSIKRTYTQALVDEQIRLEYEVAAFSVVMANKGFIVSATIHPQHVCH
jgi:hypothetical protein